MEKIPMADTFRYIVWNDHTNEPVKTFSTKRDCKNWLMKGLSFCEGAERDHYANMLAQLEAGRKTLVY